MEFSSEKIGLTVFKESTRKRSKYAAFYTPSVTSLVNIIRRSAAVFRCDCPFAFVATRHPKAKQDPVQLATCGKHRLTEGTKQRLQKRTVFPERARSSPFLVAADDVLRKCFPFRGDVLQMSHAARCSAAVAPIELILYFLLRRRDLEVPHARAGKRGNLSSERPLILVEHFTFEQLAKASSDMRPSRWR